uniref:Uncharacterized protein n=1 Tax=Panagrellus redivivus TaxID=6233 RepID=A0A7E4VDW2_PANRE
MGVLSKFFVPSKSVSTSISTSLVSVFPALGPKIILWLGSLVLLATMSMPKLAEMPYSPVFPRRNAELDDYMTVRRDPDLRSWICSDGQDDPNCNNGTSAVENIKFESTTGPEVKLSNSSRSALNVPKCHLYKRPMDFTTTFVDQHDACHRLVRSPPPQMQRSMSQLCRSEGQCRHRLQSTVITCRSSSGPPSEAIRELASESPLLPVPIPPATTRRPRLTRFHTGFQVSWCLQRHCRLGTTVLLPHRPGISAVCAVPFVQLAI